MVLYLAILDKNASVTWLMKIKSFTLIIWNDWIITYSFHVVLSNDEVSKRGSTFQTMFKLHAVPRRGLKIINKSLRWPEEFYPIIMIILQHSL